jgi:hypothetical protein
MPGDTTKVIATVALGFGLYLSFVPPPQPAAAAEAATKEDLTAAVSQLTKTITDGNKTITDSNEATRRAITDSGNNIVNAIREMTAQQQHSMPVTCGEDCRPHHHPEPTKVLLVEKVVHVASHRPHWCCRPPPPPCPPGRGWYY